MNNTRIDYTQFPGAIQAIFGLEKYVNSSGLEKSLLELVKLRASQINGCAYCVDMHTADAKKEGESDRRLHAVVVWRETPFLLLVSERLWHGLKPLPYYQRRMLLMIFIMKS